MRFIVRLVCGCCDRSVHFKNEAYIRDVFLEAGLISSTTFTDHNGVVHEGVDTFYGYTTDKDEHRGLDYIKSQLMYRDLG